MTLIDLAKLAREARDKRRAYLNPRTTSATAVMASKEADERLDRAVSEVLDPPTLNFGDDR